MWRPSIVIEAHPGVLRLLPAVHRQQVWNNGPPLLQILLCRTSCLRARYVLAVRSAQINVYQE